MKILALMTVILGVMIAVGNSLSGGRAGRVTADMHDFQYAVPLRGSQAGKTLARACGNCHSNQTHLPWYAHVAPLSWWINGHVRDGRDALNFSEWTTYSAQRRRDELESICGIISNGTMPPISYRALHPEARLGDRDKKAVCSWAANEIEEER